MIDLEASVQSIRGVGPKTAQLFAKINIVTVRDLLSRYPRSYERYEPPVPVERAGTLDFAAVEGYLPTAPLARTSGRYQVVTAVLRGRGMCSIQLVWFNTVYLMHTLRAGTRLIVRGRISEKGRQLLMEQPQVFTLQEYEGKMETLTPIYGKTAGLTDHAISKAIRQVFEEDFDWEDELADSVRRTYGLMEWKAALYQIHFPKDEDAFQKARQRLVFDEFYRFLSKVQQQKKERELEQNHFVTARHEDTDALIAALPYRLTKAQQRVLEELRSDMGSGYRMSRMIQGDVGSGKTIVAVLAMYEAAQSGFQSALMAPTEVLAQQHYQFICKLFADRPVQAELLTGSMTAAKKRAAYGRIVRHEVDFIIGTHALIQENVKYDKLGLVITDEQHRFGVNQRKALSQKGEMPHMIVMSATPIPRSLAIMLYGDLDLSLLDEKPANRLPIKNCVIDKSQRITAWKWIRGQLEKGRQAYVICPMVEQSEGMDGENVVEYAKRLCEWLGDFQVACLHGKMREEEKEMRMAAFGRGEIQVLVSTTVIEVGIDVANATVILIENADRFGLAQLHQLRGRVGRGAEQSYCIMLNTSPKEKAKSRLEVLNHSNDGFEIAAKDLKLRGPGDFFGIRQSGEMEFQLGDVYNDSEVLKLAAEAVKNTI